MQVNDQTKDFCLKDQNGNDIRLSDFKGKKVILYFYPKDNTPGCTKQACAFKSSNDIFTRNDVVVLGISKDSVKSHLNFATKYELPFHILADDNQEVINAYDVLKEKKLYGKTYMGVVRTTYLIDENGIIIKRMDKVKPDTNAQELIELLNIQ